MSYKALIDSNLSLAFNLLKDLATEVVLTKKTVPQFNFGNGNAEFGANQTVITKAIEINSNKTSENRNTIQKELMLKSKDVGDLTNYTTVTINSNTWNLGEIQKNDGFILLVKIFREA